MWCVDCSTAWNYISPVFSFTSSGKPRKRALNVGPTRSPPLPDFFLQLKVCSFSCAPNEDQVKAPSLAAPSHSGLLCASRCCHVSDPLVPILLGVICQLPQPTSIINAAISTLIISSYLLMYSKQANDQPVLMPKGKGAATF